MIGQGERIGRAAEKWLGTPHINGAKVKGVGVDCGMLLIASLEDAGVIQQDAIIVEPYSNEWHLHHSEEWFLSIVERYCHRVSEMQEGDFVMYQFGRCVSHGGVYVGDGHIVHSVIGQGVIMTDTNDVMFLDAKGKSRLRGIYRFGG